MQRFTHAMQALEFEGARPATHLLGDIQNSSDRMSIVGGELWIDAVGQAQ